MAGNGDSPRSSKLDLISISPDQVVVKRGSREVLLGGPGITRLTHQLVPFLEAGRSPAEVLARVSERDRQQAERVVHELQAGGVVVASSASDANGATADWS